MEITYEMIFGAPLGQEVRQVNGLPWYPCPAVVQLTNILRPYHAFRSLGGRSSRYDEFNRHHAGLAIDIMIDRSNAAMVTLGQHMFMLFLRHQRILRWRGMIYQHVVVTNDGHPMRHMNGMPYRATDHFNHIHIDWFDWTPTYVTKQRVQGIPYRPLHGTPQTLPPRHGAEIATRIAWPPQAETRFETDATLTSAIAALMSSRSSLEPIDLTAATSPQAS